MKTLNDLYALIKAWVDKTEADDGCTGCAFYDNEEWEMPCTRCKRNCKDYWRMKHEE